MGLVGLARRDLGGRDHLVAHVHGPVDLVLQAGATLALTYDGRIGIGGGDMALVGHTRLGSLRWLLVARGFLRLLQAGLQLPAALHQVGLEGRPAEHRVVGGIGLDEARVHKELGAVHQARLHALPHDALEEAPEGLHAPAHPGLAQHAVVRDLAVQVVAQKPQPVEPQRNRVHQLPLRAHVVENQKEHHLQDRRGRYGDIALDPVAVPDLVIDEVEIDLAPIRLRTC